MRAFLLAFFTCSLLFGANPNEAKNQMQQLKEFAASVDKANMLSVLHSPAIACEVCADIISTCLNDFNEIKRYKISIANQLIALELAPQNRIHEIRQCLKEEGYETQISSLR